MILSKEENKFLTNKYCNSLCEDCKAADTRIIDMSCCEDSFFTSVQETRCKISEFRLLLRRLGALRG